MHDRLQAKRIGQLANGLKSGVSATAFFASTTLAVAAGGANAEPEEGLSLTLMPYVWFAGIDGEVGAHGAKATVSENFVDILDQTDSLLGFVGRGDLRYGRWGGYFDVTYLRLGVDEVSPKGFGEADLKTDQALVDAALLYRVADTRSKDGTGDGRGLSLDLLAGVRYNHVKNDLDFVALGSLGQSKDWVDPIVGGELTLDLSERWGVKVHGDVGGFGAASDLTWSAFGAVSYRFTLGGVRSAVFAGYKAVGTDYSSGSGLNEFTWDAVLHGPILGLIFTF